MTSYLRASAPRRRLVAVAALAGILAACSSGTGTETDDRDVTTADVESVAGSAGESSTALATTAPTGETTAPTTAAPTTAAPTTAAPTTTAPPTTLAAPSGGVFPDDEWEIGELPADDQAALDAAVEVAFGAADATSRVRSIVVVQGGEITYERYHPLDGPDTVMPSFSVAKSVTSAVIGLLVGDGLLDVDERAPVDAWDDPSDPRHEITLEHLLHMASGLEWTEAYGEGSQVRQMFAADVAWEVPASASLEADPGTAFEYSTGTTSILAGIATDTLGGVDAFDDYVDERLLDPLGITSIEFLTDRSGHWYGGLGADMTTRDFARFGLLYLNDGIWDGRRILPEGWVDYSHEPSPTNPSYGAQWWMFREGAFEARGLFGQIVLVSQDHDLVIAINTTQGGDADTLVSAAYEALSS
ncbi:MAG: serine hydrolase [Acidimicrobiales bacterium]|nr:serine hydrolase [Acidimicrobiales bacterium]MCB9393268.1 serine hydrolase [Acidimicrobiaceae bacterium]